MDMNLHSLYGLHSEHYFLIKIKKRKIQKNFLNFKVFTLTDHEGIQKWRF